VLHLHDTFGRPDGEPFSLTSGASGWPAEFFDCWFVPPPSAPASFISPDARAFFELTRKYRLSFQSPDNPEPITGVCIVKFWQQHKVNGRLSQRLKTPFNLPLGPVRWRMHPGILFVRSGPLQRCARTQRVVVEPMLIWGSGILFLVLAFLMMDSARMCVNSFSL